MNAPFEPFIDDEPTQLRIPPHSAEAETSVIGGLLIDNGAWDRVGDLVKESDFYRLDNRLIFGAIAVLINSNRPADVVTVFEHLQRQGKAEEAGGLTALNALAQFLPSAANMRRYAEIVRERSVLRQVIAAADEMATAAFNPQDMSSAEVVDLAQQKIFVLGEKGEQREDWQDGDAGAVQVLDGIQRRADGETNFLPTGLEALDDKLDGGMRPGEVIVIGARPSMGKTALALTIGENAANAGEPVGVLSMEMPTIQVQNRRVSMRSGVPLHKIKRPERMSDYDWSCMSDAVEKMRRVPVFVSDQPSLNINQVRSKARRLKKRHGLRVLVVDYIGLMEGTDRKATRATQLGEVSRGMKSLAKELGITVLLLAQLNREVEKRTNMRPILADLRECGDIEQDADVIVFVHRPIHSKPDLGPEWKHYAELIVAKNRDGETGVLDAQYVGETVRFMDWKGDKPTSLTRTKGGEL
jgi:replicative DNA helicase